MPPHKAQSRATRRATATRKSTRNKLIDNSEDEKQEPDDVVLAIEDMEPVAESAVVSAESTTFELENEPLDQSDKSPTSEQNYPCLECGDEFCDMEELARHEVSGHESKGFQCHVCDKVFTRKYHLDRHMHLTACSGKPPPGESLLIQHTAHTNPTAHPCDICGKVYTRLDNLREHQRVHAGEVTRRKKHQCPQCNKTFHGASLLKIHERTHSGEKPYQCDFCPKSFPSGGGLTKHRRIHTGEKPYSCPNCDACFSLKGTLNRHMRIHTGIRPHKCSHCGKEFIQAGGLKAHMFFHTQENGFKCEFCDKVFNRKARLQMHTRYVHEPDVRPFECESCDKRFTRKEDLNRHAVLHTGKKVHQCTTCYKTFAIKPSLKLHLLTHTKEEPCSCSECGRAFIRRDCLMRHMRKRHRFALEQKLEEERLLEEANKTTINFADAVQASQVLPEEKLIGAIMQLLTLLVDEATLKAFGWPAAPVDQVLESVIRRCSHSPVNPDEYEYFARLRENAKILFTVVIDDNSVKTLLNNQTVDEVILHVLRLAQQ